jgi:hypothetical protein
MKVAEASVPGILTLFELFACREHLPYVRHVNGEKLKGNRK